ncbi:MAG: NAD(P)/FAD-dependent oxidoreductase [Pseudomonadota bacterium]
MTAAAANTVDVLIIGAGLSGISAAHHLKTRAPEKSFAILEARDDIGGTWDLFRYPGVRSDSDMFTLGYGFRPWRGEKSIADGASIKAYIKETAEREGFSDDIRFGRRVVAMRWRSDEALWRVEARCGESLESYSCRFVIVCTGYYRYDGGHTPAFVGVEDFGGDVIHPQNWPASFDPAGKRIAVIGSGATAVGLVPALAKQGAHVTMIQRSPTYLFSMPSESAFARGLRSWLPAPLANRLVRWQKILFQQLSYKLVRATPRKTAKKLIKLVREKLPEGFDVERHFQPSYDPWDQRLCVIADDDLFDAISRGEASIVTDEIERFTEDGVRMASGENIQADAIVTATGLYLQYLGGADLYIDDQKKEPGDALTYRGAMFDGVPNFVFVGGYTNASWTLRAELVNAFACRLIGYLDDHGFDYVAPMSADPAMARRPIFNLTSGYVSRAADRSPKQGDRAPWLYPQDYFADLRSLKFAKLDDGVLRFGKAKRAEPAARADAA